MIMKRIFTLAIAISSISGGAFAQGELDAFNLSYNNLKGTARSVSMGGAFGALGGDASGVAINPAGIGTYSRSEVVTTLNFTNTQSKTNLFGSSVDKNKFKFNFDNIAFMGSMPIDSDVAPIINFGFSYNNLKSFNRTYQVKGYGINNSFTDYAAWRANERDDYKYITANNAYDNGADWMSVLAYQSGLITGKDGVFSPARRSNETVNSDLLVREKGYINAYEFNMGTTFADMLSFGVSVAITDIDYHMYSGLAEEFSSNNDRYVLDNELKTEGTGWQVKTGLIFKPINELRIGVAYHSPTWYKMTDSYYGGVGASWNNKTYYVTPDYAYTDYELRTPDKWVFSLATVIGKYAIISADYELTNYSSMHLADDNGRAYTYDNQYIKQDFKNSSTLRVGAEVRFTPQFSGRVGYMWQQSPFDKNLKDGREIPATAGTVPQYSVVGDANYFTWGLGYRFTPQFYTDVAFVIKSRKDDLYQYATGPKAELKTNQFTGLVTLGYKF